MALTDFEGAQYDPAKLFALQQQILPRLDPSMQAGGAWGQAGQNIGFDYGQANQLFQQQYGHPMSIADQISLDMARNLYQQGITDMSQLSSKDITKDEEIKQLPNMVGTNFGYYYGNEQTPHYLTPEEVAQYVKPGPDGSLGTMPAIEGKGIYGPDGKPYMGSGPFNYGGDNSGSAVGATFTGKGGTSYEMVPDASGNLSFRSHANTTSDFDKQDLMGVLSVLGATFGGAMLGGGAAGGSAGAEALAPEMASAAAYPEFASWTGASSYGAGAGAGLGSEMLSPELSSLSSYPEYSSWTGPSSFGGAVSPEMLSPETSSPSSYPDAPSNVPGAPPVPGGPNTPGVPPNPFANPSSLIPSGLTNLLGPAATLGGALLGSKGSLGGTDGGASTSKDLPSYLQGPLTQDLFPRTQGLLDSQMPAAQQAGQSMMNAGGGLLGRSVAGNGYGSVGTNVAGNGYDSLRASNPVAGNGFGQVQMQDPASMMNPYYGNMANDIQRRTNEMLANNNQQIAGNAVGVGGLGGSRQGVAQGLAAAKAGDYLSGNLASLGGNMYQTALSGALNKYGTDTSFYGNQRGQDIANYATDAGVYGQQRGQDIAKSGQDQQFYGTQRGMDLTQAGIGQGLLSAGLQTQWAPLMNANDIYKPYANNGTTTQTFQQPGGGLQGALGGALGVAQLGKNFGWW